MKLAIEPDWQSVEGTRISAVVRGDGINEAHYDGGITMHPRLPTGEIFCSVRFNKLETGRIEIAPTS